MNILILQEVEKQLLSVLGQLSLVTADPNGQDDEYLLQLAKGEIKAMIFGLRNIIDNSPETPMTLGELEDRQFHRAKLITDEFLELMQQNAQ